MGDKTRGIYQKFKVERTDGKSAPGEKHDGCEYFVLDTGCDPHAIPALLAYAESCKADYPLLAADVRKMAVANCDHEWTETLHGELIMSLIEAAIHPVETFVLPSCRADGGTALGIPTFPKVRADTAGR